MDEQRFAELEKKVDAIYVSVEKTRKYFLVAVILNVVMVLVPLAALLFLIPYLLRALSGYQDLLL